MGLAKGQQCFVCCSMELPSFNKPSEASKQCLSWNSGARGLQSHRFSSTGKYNSPSETRKSCRKHLTRRDIVLQASQTPHSQVAV